MTTPKRPRDTNQLAKLVVDIASGEKSVKNKSFSRPDAEELPKLLKKKAKAKID